MGTETKKITDLFNTAENCTNVVQMYYLKFKVKKGRKHEINMLSLYII